VAFFVSPWLGIATIVLYIVIQQVENALVVPKVMERAVSLHPLAVMLALLIGGELYGVAGAILSVPVAAAVSVVLIEIRRERDEARLAEETSALAAVNSAVLVAGEADPAATPLVPPTGEPPPGVATGGLTATDVRPAGSVGSTSAPGGDT
jgi:hypothetical protein